MLCWVSMESNSLWPLQPLSQLLMKANLNNSPDTPMVMHRHQKAQAKGSESKPKPTEDDRKRQRL
jgi:hypothetical protein